MDDSVGPVTPAMWEHLRLRPHPKQLEFFQARGEIVLWSGGGVSGMSMPVRPSAEWIKRLLVDLD